MQQTTHTVTIGSNTMTVSCEEYVKPGQSVPVIFVLNVLDEMDIENGHTEHKYGAISPKLLVSDIACCFKQGTDKLIDHVMKHKTFIEAMSKESSDFIADLAIYLQWTGMIFAPATDAFYSLFNSIKDFVSANWKKESRMRFYQLID